MHQAPFTIYFSIVPKGASRLERLRSIQKVSAVIYQELQEIADIVTAQPGGSQNVHWNMHNFSNLGPGTQVKPQFGESPAQLSITGFYVVDNPLLQSYANHNLVFGGKWVAGPTNAHLAGALAAPVTSVQEEVKALRAIFDTQATIVNDFFDMNVKVYRLVYKGITWGNRGLHFPS